MIFTNRWDRQLLREQRTNEDRLNATYFLLSFIWYNKWNSGNNIKNKHAKQIRIRPSIDWTPRLLTENKQNELIFFQFVNLKRSTLIMILSKMIDNPLLSFLNNGWRYSLSSSSPLNTPSRSICTAKEKMSHPVLSNMCISSSRQRIHSSQLHRWFLLPCFSITTRTCRYEFTDQNDKQRQMLIVFFRFKHHLSPSFRCFKHVHMGDQSDQCKYAWFQMQTSRQLTFLTIFTSIHKIANTFVFHD